MKEAKSCFTCNRPANSVFDKSKWGTDRTFCSQECSKADDGVHNVIFGSVLILFSFIFVTSSFNLFFLLFLSALWLIMLGLYRRGNAQPKLELLSHIENNKFKSDLQDPFIYSNILKAEVRPCCHQSARLNDKYCACGRVIEYPL